MTSLANDLATFPRGSTVASAAPMTPPGFARPHDPDPSTLRRSTVDTPGFASARHTDAPKATDAREPAERVLERVSFAAIGLTALVAFCPLVLYLTAIAFVWNTAACLRPRHISARRDRLVNVTLLGALLVGGIVALPLFRILMELVGYNVDGRTVTLMGILLMFWSRMTMALAAGAAVVALGSLVLRLLSARRRVEPSFWRPARIAVTLVAANIGAVACLLATVAATSGTSQVQQFLHVLLTPVTH